MAVDDAGGRTPRILFVDAYDSFSENVVALLRRLLNAHVVTIRIDDDDADADADADVDADADNGLDRRENTGVPGLSLPLRSYDAIVIGPGPGSPDSSADTGRLDEIWKNAAENEIPVLGICLGFQSLCSRYGLAVTRFDMPCHGHTKRILHRDMDVFKDVGEIVATNYNSLGVRAKLPIGPSLAEATSSPSPSLSLSPSVSASTSAKTHSSRPQSFRSTSPSSQGSVSVQDQNQECSLPVPELELLAVCEDGYLMAVKHTSLPFWGLQFHPESCLSNAGCHQVLINWWARVQEHNGMATTRLQHDHVQGNIASPSCTAATAESVQLRTVLQRLLQSCTGTVSFRCLDSNVSLADMTRVGQWLCNGETAAVRLESSIRGRFSIYALTDHQSWLLEQAGKMCQIRRQAKVEFAAEASPERTLVAVEEAFSSILVTGGAEEVPFWGGLIGYLSYEAGLDLTMPRHQHPDSSGQPRTLPNVSLLWVERSIVHDKETGRIWVQSLRESDSKWIDETIAKLQAETCQTRGISAAPAPAAASPSNVDLSTPLSISNVNLPDHNSYVSAIQSCQSQLHVGNSYELCLTTEATVKTSAAPDALYASLQAVNGALYSAYLRLDQTTILSCSPEQFLSWNRSDPQLDMTPMKGTVAKGPGVTRHQAEKLLRTPKEEAENLMIVDLIRHDLHRALGLHGRVEVKSLYELVETENTYQLISHIRGYVPLAGSAVDGDGDADDDDDKVDQRQRQRQRERSRQIMHYGHKTLRTALPPGSMTGAPKIRSCSILADLEQRHRGVYSGVIGYFDIGGGGCWSVAIRCAFSHASQDELVNTGERLRTWHVGAGGAITVLSDEEDEWEEMRLKMGGVLKGFSIGGIAR